MKLIETSKGNIAHLTHGDEILFCHGKHMKKKVVAENEAFFVLGTLVFEPKGNNHRLILSDPEMDSQFDGNGIMADISLVINTNVINSLLIFREEAKARDFLNQQNTEEVIRETIEIQSQFSQLPVQALV